MGYDLHYFEELESTNSYMKQVGGDKIAHGSICLADHQTKGRGQYERNWVSAPGQNLTFTMAFRPSAAERLHVLTLTCARVAVQIIENSTGIEAFIKWPNDIVLNGKKTGGLLTETVFSGNSLDRVLVGAGLNINQESFGPSLKESATSLSLETGSTFDREQLLADFMGLCEYYYGLWSRNDTALLKSINQKIIGYGEWIGLSVNGHDYSGRYKLIGINERGELAVINEDAEVETFSYEQIRLITD